MKASFGFPLGRWARARRWLPPDARRVLDVGCAFGFGSAVLAQPSVGGARRLVAGFEHDAGYAAQARHRYPWLPVVRADAAALPVRDGGADVVTLLDVLEHVVDPRALVTEARRVLSPQGHLILTVPHAGLLAGLDSLNVYAALRRRWPWLSALEPSEQSGGGVHRHFALEELRALLDQGFTIDRVARTGIGLAEPSHVLILLLCRALLRRESLYRALRYVYFTLYLLEDLIPSGRAGYHVAIRARAIGHAFTAGPSRTG